MGLVHYDKVVEDLGGYVEIVQKEEGIMPAIKRAIDSRKRVFVNVLTDPNVTSMATLLLLNSLKIE